MRVDNGNRWPEPGDVPLPDRVVLHRWDRVVLWLLACALAVAIGVVVAWAAGDTDGIVADKREVQQTECHDICRLKTCYQVTYVTDDGHRRKLCLPKGRYERINLGDRISG
ncbi:hypothetical protein DLE60_28520 [Micromonospora globispora]|uniref:hypothetical protein n=1 Tax=Micromonospora globispora TaxID=1450148 RepID=UPI000D6EED2D|nr:hypothetical protein [Micromonospora globispora]PWU55189.1 hypothetical protein DLE60_28520 [Micromonospora globispora]